MYSRAITNITPLQKKDVIIGKEWGSVLRVIRDDIIGAKKYQKLSEQKNKLNKHIIEMLDELDLLSYYRVSKLIHILFSDILPSDMFIHANFSDIKIKSKGNINYCTYVDKVVDVCWLPSLSSQKPQALVSYLEYKKIIALLKSKSSSKVSDNDFDFEDIIKSALKENVSDIHITFSEEYYYVSFKIDGRLVKQEDYLLNTEAGLSLIERIKILASGATKGKFSSDEHFKAQDARIEFPHIGENGVDVRVMFIPDGKLKNMGMTARLLKKEILSEPNFSRMGYDETFIERVTRVSKKQNGLMIASGITGSGKSMLMANIIAGMDNSKRIYTIEDPIEYIISSYNITQHQIFEPKEEHMKMGFSEYTKALKRGDPDVVNIGEMRNDEELVRSIMEMSEAGQLVLTTVHISSAYSIYSRLEQIFNVDTKISIPLILFSVNQILVGKLCERCKIEDKNGVENIKKLKEVEGEIPFGNKENLHALFEDREIDKLYLRGKGCEYCLNGISGRVPLYEYFSPNVEFMEWLSSFDELPLRFTIENKVKELDIGSSKLETYVKKLRDGVVDTDDETLIKLL